MLVNETAVVVRMSLVSCPCRSMKRSAMPRWICRQRMHGVNVGFQISRRNSMGRLENEVPDGDTE